MIDKKDIPDLYKVTRAQTEHIDNTLSQRIVWLVLTQSFFFSAFAIVITSNPLVAFMADKQKLLGTLLPVVAIIMVILSYFDIIAGVMYLGKLCKTFNDDDICEASKELPYPPLGGYGKLNFVKNLSSLIVPGVFFVTWLIILFHK